MQGCCSHDHDCGDLGCGGTSLLGEVDVARATCLNAVDAEAGLRGVFRPWDTRAERAGITPLESDDDDPPELLLHVPFVAPVKLRGLVVGSDPDGSAPTEARAFINRDDIDFALAQDLAPVQAWQTQPDPNGILEYQTRFTKFQAVSSLTLHFPNSHGGDATRIWYIGLRGETTGHRREAVTNVVYEARPQLKDHRLPAEDGAPQMGL